MLIFTQYIYNVFSKYEKEQKFKSKKGLPEAAGVGESPRP
jgi:hypothetical protein